MRWFQRLHRHNDPFADPPLEIDLLVERCLHNRAAAQTAIDTLRAERKRIGRQRRQVIRRSSMPSGGQIRTLARGGGQMSEVLVSQALNNANAHAEAQQRRDELLTALDARDASARRAIERLKRVR